MSWPGSWEGFRPEFCAFLVLTLICPLAKLFTWVQHSFAPRSTVNNIQILRYLCIIQLKNAQFWVILHVVLAFRFDLLFLFISVFSVVSSLNISVFP